ncbi:ABC-2 type transporter [Xylanimonas cellulosilytica DSM 15894]|uniref:ABC-2 type transporter n=1 Tax=Xylanimonas cellulosilytica (strain DSM 15894 / JCM 12276 / CECT 5975 / KCTC 9989 / LMG 20990 / NBRC 107835 / XIL07) TaxID=446471 RepID=D1BX33_XYLCX|nr:ABC transporter permease [Xylanimonas cellulosilytica]ACZ31601.1 ABC-2 type transporter [Xylanimonas cellulosilytica DSM 15894]
MTQTNASGPSGSAATPGVPVGAVPARLTSDQAADLAAQSGLRQMGVRPPLGLYLKSVWARRSFIWNLSASRAYTRNQGSYLGQAWQLISPTLDAAVFILVFGVILGASRGVENVAAFITVGTFSYALFARTVSAGVSSITSNVQLVRSHQFPRAVVPASTSMTELVLFVPTLVMMVVLSVLTGAFIPSMGAVYPAWSWLLLPVAAVLLAAFSMGCAFFLARLGARTPDVANLLPFFVGLGRFGSGVMFSVTAQIGVENRGTWWALIVEWQPLAVYLNLFRAAMGNEPSIQLTPALWLWATGYAVVFLVAGFIFFWRAEETYGRD